MRALDLQSPLAALRDFERNPVRAGRELREALNADSGAFLRALVETKSVDTSNRGFRYAMILLLHNDVLLPAIVDPAVTTFDQAIQLTRHMLRMDTNFINSLLAAVLLRPALARNPASTLRVLDIAQECVDHLGNWRSIARIHQSGDVQIRTRCAGLIARYRFEDPAGLERFCAADPRVRANIVEMLWSVDKSRATALMEAAARDPSNRVKGNACLAYYNEGKVRSLVDLAGMLESSDEKKKVTAAWVMGQTRDARFGGRLLEAMRREHAEIRKTAINSLARLHPLPRPESEAHAACRYDVDVSFVSAPLNPAATEADDREFWLRIVGPDGEPVPGVSPIDFFVSDGDEFLLDYSVEAFVSGGDVHLGIVYPVGCASLVGALVGSLSFKPPDQAWAIHPYKTSVAGKYPSEESRTPGYEADGGILEASLTATSFPAAGVSEAVERVLGSTAHSGERHLALIVEASPTRDDIGAIQSLCRRKNVILHYWSLRGAVEESGPSPARGRDGVEMPPRPGCDLTPGPTLPRIARRFWEAETAPPCPTPERPSSEDRGTTTPECAGMRHDVPAAVVTTDTKGWARIASITRDEAECARKWPHFVASLSSRYVLRTKRHPTAVVIRKTGDSGVRFSDPAVILKGRHNG